MSCYNRHLTVHKGKIFPVCPLQVTDLSTPSALKYNIINALNQIFSNKHKFINYFINYSNGERQKTINYKIVYKQIYKLFKWGKTENYLMGNKFFFFIWAPHWPSL